MAVVQPAEEEAPAYENYCSRTSDGDATNFEISANGNDSDSYETASEHEGRENEDDHGEEIQEVDENRSQKEEGSEEDGRENEDDRREGTQEVDKNHSQEEEGSEDEASRKESREKLENANDEKLEGNKLYVAGMYEDALVKYGNALNVAAEINSSTTRLSELCSMCHANRAICFLKLGKYEDTIEECTKTLEINPSYIKALIRRGEAYEKKEMFENALDDMKKALEVDPSNDQARTAIPRLEVLHAEKSERMKQEMIGKLKEMGNSLLGRFGMSLDNFKTVKDPSTGTYQFTFQQ